MYLGIPVIQALILEIEPKRRDYEKIRPDFPQFREVTNRSALTGVSTGIDGETIYSLFV